MEDDRLFETLCLAIRQIREPRLFSTERGYQGQLATELDKLIEDQPDAILRPLVEQEYQKTAHAHRITLRPDIIVHIPFDRGVSPTRNYDNHLVILLKLAANQKKAEEDFADLETICSVLDYPLGVFVNITSRQVFLPEYHRQVKGPFGLREVAVDLQHGQPTLLTAAS